LKRREGKNPAAAFTIIEAMMSVAIVSIMTTAMLTSLASSRMTMAATANRSVAMLLAQQLMQEVLAQPYLEAGTITLGTDSGEAGTTRNLFDDVDDYNGWTETPPAAKDGTLVSGAAGYTRMVAVDWVTTANLKTTSATDKGVKRIVVTVKKGAMVLATLTAIRTNGAVAGLTDQTSAPQ
jgi:MSHA pilin protein MshD